MQFNHVLLMSQPLQKILTSYLIEANFRCFQPSLRTNQRWKKVNIHEAVGGNPDHKTRPGASMITIITKIDR